MRIAILTFDGFNELDTFISAGLLNDLKAEGWKAELACPTGFVTSMNGVVVQAQQPLEFANEADAVIFAGGIYARAIAENIALLDRLQLDPLRQLLAGQSSGVLLMARLGLLADMPACTDSASKPWVVAAGVRVIEAPFHAKGPIASAGGCLASKYLAAWMMLTRAGVETAHRALQRAAPVGEKDDYVARVLKVVQPFVDEHA